MTTLRRKGGITYFLYNMMMYHNGGLTLLMLETDMYVPKHVSNVKKVVDKILTI